MTQRGLHDETERQEQELQVDPANQPIRGQSKRDSKAIQQMRKARLEEARHDAVTLSELADSLKRNLASLDPNTLNLDTAKSAEKIEKLAKKIKNWARGN